MKHTPVEWFAHQLGITSGTMLEKALEIEKDSFSQLYEFRKAYNVALFNYWGKYTISMPSDKMEMRMYDVHKSWRHHDGELCFGGGWFIVVAYLPEGQISNHYEAKDWDLFKIPEREKATYPFDGHTGEDVIKRLLKLY